MQYTIININDGHIVDIVLKDSRLYIDVYLYLPKLSKNNGFNKINYKLQSCGSQAASYIYVVSVRRNFKSRNNECNGWKYKCVSHLLFKDHQNLFKSPQASTELMRTKETQSRKKPTAVGILIPLGPPSSPPAKRLLRTSVPTTTTLMQMNKVAMKIIL